MNPGSFPCQRVLDFFLLCRGPCTLISSLGHTSPGSSPLAVLCKGQEAQTAGKSPTRHGTALPEPESPEPLAGGLHSVLERGSKGQEGGRCGVDEKMTG